ncbi:MULTISPECIES: hypothetical protein [unclassified Streptomyces]|uniref:hypothetical protein n=1 Tax=unclassified Streptomyces TaxID=2593676 RepID=UPI00070E657F|nr:MULTISPECIES: hypothetical protein [unclassified Streptomyces]KRD01416.1 hypothetical protein ASE41_34895 [Streptomyces sp. Root264]
MAAARNGNEGLGAWRVVPLIGAVVMAVGLIGSVPVLTLVGAVVALVGVIGLSAARRKQN